jgi:hypothetical protein
MSSFRSLPLRLLLCGAAALVTQACADTAPVTLIALADTVVHNGPAPLALPARVTDARGRPVAASLIVESHSPVVVVEGEGIRCLGPGDADVIVKHGARRVFIHLLCRPIARFGPPLEPLDLVVGGVPRPLPVNALDHTGRPVRELRFSAISNDTSVVAVVDGVAIPRGPGAAHLLVDFGGLTTELATEVVTPIVRDTIAAAAGEYRYWSLGRGRYRAEFRIIDTLSVAKSLSWGSSDANCAFDNATRSVIHCIVADSGAIVIAAEQRARAVIRVDQRPR